MNCIQSPGIFVGIKEVAIFRIMTVLMLSTFHVLVATKMRAVCRPEFIGSLMIGKIGL